MFMKVALHREARKRGGALLPCPQNLEKHALGFL
jgi:hypothetical protein